MATPESSPPATEADAYREKLRSLSFGTVPGGSRTASAGKLRKPDLNNGWERGIKGERRVDGSFMPYIDQNGDPIRMKQWSENQHGYEEQLAQLRKPQPETDKD